MNSNSAAPVIFDPVAIEKHIDKHAGKVFIWPAAHTKGRKTNELAITCQWTTGIWKLIEVWIWDYRLEHISTSLAHVNQAVLIESTGADHAVDERWCVALGWVAEISRNNRHVCLSKFMRHKALPFCCSPARNSTAARGLHFMIDDGNAVDYVGKSDWRSELMRNLIEAGIYE